MSNATKYNNDYKKEHYDRINVLIAKGYKERIKEKADSLGVGLSEYIFTLICNDLDGATTDIAEQKQGFRNCRKITYPSCTIQHAHLG